MSVYRIIGSEIRRYGTSVTVSDGSESVERKGFIQPLRYRSRVSVGGVIRDLGKLRRERYLFIGTADCELHENRSVIESADGKYIVKRCETFYFGSSPVYVWAVLERYSDALEDDYDADMGAD